MLLTIDMNKILISVLSLLVSGIAAAKSMPRNQAEKNTAIEKSRIELASVDSPEDSIKILYDIFDLSTRKESIPVARQIYQTAEREDNREVMLDIARQLSSFFTQDNELDKIIMAVSKLPTSKEQKETILYLRLRKIAVKARYESEENRVKAISETLASVDDNKLSEHARIERLFKICQYLSNYAKGDMLVEYLDRLNALMKKSDIELDALYSQYYTASANIYTATENHDKAIEIDKELLKIIDNLEKSYKAKGREYRNYDINRYIIYRRMLSNFKALSVDEVNDIYEKILEIVARNSDVAEDFAKNKRSLIAYYLKNQKFKEALPFLRAQIKIEDSLPLKRQLIQDYKDAATTIGDKNAELEAVNMYNDILSGLNELQSEAKYNELRIRYDVNRLRARNALLELQKKEEAVAQTRNIMTFVIIGWVIFAILLFIMLYYWSKYKSASSGLLKLLDKLATERNDLKARIYRDKDRVHEANKEVSPEVYKWAPPRKKSPLDMAEYLINDVLYIASVGSESTSKFIRTVDIDKFMRAEAHRMKATLPPNISIDVKFPEHETPLKTDYECLEYLTRHILKAAVSLAPATGGTVGFYCREEKTVGQLRIEFTHTGEALPFGEEEKIFEHFVNTESIFRHNGVALFLCRMTNFLLHNNLRSDRNYKNGGKMILSIPMEKNRN